MAENKEIIIRIEEVEECPEKKKFYRVIINRDGKLFEIMTSKQKPKVLSYKSKIVS